MEETLSADELVELVVGNGYVRAAELVGVSHSHLWQLAKRAGVCDVISAKRGRLPRAKAQEAAAVLGVCEKTVQAMRRDGRLPLVFGDQDVERLRKSWTVVLYARAAEEASRWDRRWRRCRACGSFFRVKASWVRQGRGQACSNKCSGELKSRAAIPKLTVKFWKPPKPLPTRTFIGGQCSTCGDAFVVKMRKAAAPYCSATCAAKGYREVRKARERGAVKTQRIFRRKVYERDKWTCHICGKKIDQALDAPHPGSATLDHIHPLSLGGTHTYDNVKAAHYGCNSGRGNRAEFQMRMPVAA